MSAAPPTDAKETLHRYLQTAREALLWKLEGLSEYDVRRPMTGTGTNLLGLVKHVASVELGYLGETFGRPAGIDLPWFADDAAPNADLWVTPQESRADIVGLYHASWAHGDATIQALDLGSPGRVPHWRADRAAVTLHQILVHLIAETHRHAGHADIIREEIDGAVGLRPGNDNMWGLEEDYWSQHRQRIEDAAREAGGDGGR